MAATFNWGEDNGAQTGSPARGTTRSGIGNTNYPTDMSWKNTDDARWASGGTLYSASPITAGQNSYEKYQYGIFSGTFNQISALKWSAHTADTGSLGGTLHLKGKVTQTYTTPVTTATGGSPTDFTSIVAIGSGLAVNVGATGPEAAGHASSSTTVPSYTDYLVTQLQTDAGAPAGDTPTVTATLQYNEN